MTHWNDHGTNGWGFGLMTVGMLLFWGLVVVGGLVLLRRLDRLSRQRPGHPPAPPDPEQLLAERYARGEIDTEEYRHRLEILRLGPGPVSGGPAHT
jgi:putative membrane protein